ncbi:MAG: dehydratase [Propionibacteriaceae bacterium]|jgi:acyl dehydratase|nr:dehydratase [Propionibacteriaceae bacterium]
MTALPLTIGPETYTITRFGTLLYAAASGDWNPIHWSDRQARNLGLPGVITHGLYTMGIALRAVTDWLGGDASRVVSYKLRFARPVLLPDDDDGVDLRVIGKVVAQGETTWTVRLEVACAGQPVLSRVSVEVKAPDQD